MPEPINLTPVGVEKDPGRVTRAVEAFHTANAGARDALRDLINAHAPGSFDAHARALAYYAGRKALAACDEAQEEFLRAVAGVPSRGAR